MSGMPENVKQTSDEDNFAFVKINCKKYAILDIDRNRCDCTEIWLVWYEILKENLKKISSATPTFASSARSKSVGAERRASGIFRVFRREMKGISVVRSLLIPTTAKLLGNTTYIRANIAMSPSTYSNPRLHGNREVCGSLSCSPTIPRQVEAARSR